ncbi:biotin--[acetyl-CoA-carboxylase] ligase [Rhabdaerophilum calidifontis]|uniref:biotin--[acetyl-CoA-carboxylase] ligase n=1 Tax=Rhabdaerophilum calidifontis TaxID=2604328 RepID=UPI00123C4D38|nr:biotin--[acetyl-CoA-carboxylase] ligase [Rhabdaerophilum calidifontis]
MDLSDAARAAGFSLQHRDEIGSTNSAALAAAEAGRDRAWIVADRQMAGRGRHGRGWVSPAGNLHASLALVDPCPPAATPLLGFVAGLSLAEAILALAPGLRLVLALKWPNDCLIAGEKLAGILLEGASRPGGGQAVAIGIGVNVAAVPEGLDQPATALHRHAPHADAAALFAPLSARLAANLALFARGGGFPAIRAGWLAHALPEGAPIRVRLPSGERNGVFAGLGADGQLLIRTAGGLESIIAGDVVGAAPMTPEAAVRTHL